MKSCGETRFAVDSANLRADRGAGGNPLIIASPSVGTTGERGTVRSGHGKVWFQDELVSFPRKQGVEVDYL